MKYYRKLKFTRDELDDMVRRMDGYIWVAIDARRGIISAGDEFMADLRDELLVRRSHLEDIFGLGLNLSTGEISYIDSCNRRNPAIGCDGKVPDERRERIETLVHYFFDGIAPFVADVKRLRYSRKPANTSATH